LDDAVIRLTSEQNVMLEGNQGRAVQKAMQILVALGKIYEARRMIPVSSVQIAGVSYDNLGDAGLEFLSEMAEQGGRARVLTTLNPAGMDIENWETLGISAEFAERQQRVIDVFLRMNVITTCSCTPYLAGNASLWRAYRLVREQRRLLCQFCPGRTHQPRGGSQRTGFCPNWSDSRIWLPFDRESPA
jgi:predicted aconitase